MLNGSNDDCSDISYTSADGAVTVIASKDLRGNENVRMRALTDSKEAIGQVHAGKIKSLQPILKGVTLYLSTFDRKIDNNTSESSSQDEYLNGSVMLSHGWRCHFAYVTVRIISRVTVLVSHKTSYNI